MTDDNTAEDAEAILDEAIFGNINNQLDWNDDWQITFEGENFVVRHFDSGDLYHFRVAIEPHEWDSEQARKDQGWDVEDDEEA